MIATFDLQQGKVVLTHIVHILNSLTTIYPILHCNSNDWLIPKEMQKSKNKSKFIRSSINKCWPFKRQPHKNGQTHSNNSSALADKLFECVWPFCGVGASRVNPKPSMLYLHRIPANFHIYFNTLKYSPTPRNDLLKVNHGNTTKSYVQS